MVRALALLGFYALLSAAPAHADRVLPDDMAFFTGDVRKWDGDELELRTQRDLEYFPTVPSVPEHSNLSQPKMGNPAKPDSNRNAPIKPSGDPVADKLMGQFGDPESVAPVAAIDSAPKPFKGMLAAINEGRDDLAFRYAVQYVRYTQDLKKNTNKAMALQGVAMQGLGMLPENGWQSTPEMSGLVDRAALLKQLTANMDSREKADELAGKLEGLLKKAGIQEDTEAFNATGQTGGKEPAAADEGSERARARALAGKLPVDPRGKVDVYLFMMPQDSRAIAMVKELEQFRKIHGEAFVPNVVGMVLDAMDPVLEGDIREASGATFPIIDGRKLASQLNINQTPVLVFVASSTSRVYAAPGMHSAYFVDEAVRIMEGR